MVKTKYVCRVCNSFKSFNPDEVKFHEGNPVQDIKIEGLILKDKIGKYHFFNKVDYVDEEHQVHYKKNIVCEEDKPGNPIEEAKTMSLVEKLVLPYFSGRRKHTLDNTMAKKMSNSGWEIVDDPGYQLYFNKNSFQKTIFKENLTEVKIDEFIDVVRNIKKANPEYAGVEFKHKIPDKLK